MVELSLFEKFPPRRNIYALDQDRDNIFDKMLLANIPIYDYTASGNPQAGELRIFQLNDDVIVDSGELSGVRQYLLGFRGRYLEKFKKN